MFVREREGLCVYVFEGTKLLYQHEATPVDTEQVTSLGMIDK